MKAKRGPKSKVIYTFDDEDVTPKVGGKRDREVVKSFNPAPPKKSNSDELGEVSGEDEVEVVDELNQTGQSDQTGQSVDAMEVENVLVE